MKDFNIHNSGDYRSSVKKDMCKKKNMVLVAFRTHYWDEITDALARKLYGQVAGLDFVVLADETHNTYDVGPFRKVSHTNQFSYLGLPDWTRGHDNILHYNGDYALYALRHAEPNYDFYFLVENDAIINIDIEKILVNSARDGVDLIAMIDEVNSELHTEWHRNVKRWFNNTGRAFFPVVGVSAEMLDQLYQKRVNLMKEENAEADWPYCETYVASMVLSKPQAKIVNLSDIADLSDYTFMRHKYIEDPKVHIYGKICHPIAGNNFVIKNLIVNDVIDIFNHKSDLYTGVKSMNTELFVNILDEKMKEKKDHDIYYRFKDMCLLEGWVREISPINQAFARPATQSSVCHASRFPTCEKDAAQIVDGFLTTESKSHTDIEKNPWVQIDLVSSMEIRSILIYVRPNNFHKFNNFKIELSNDAVSWETVYIKSDDIVPDAADLKPIIVNFPKNLFGRFVKIQLIGFDCLHLNQVEVYSY